MRMRLLHKPELNNYMKLYRVDVADEWRERNVWYSGRSAWDAPKGVATEQGNEAVLNVRKPAEAYCVT